MACILPLLHLLLCNCAFPSRTCPSCVSLSYVSLVHFPLVCVPRAFPSRMCPLMCPSYVSLVPAPRTFPSCPSNVSLRVPRLCLPRFPRMFLSYVSLKHAPCAFPSFVSLVRAPHTRMYPSLVRFPRTCPSSVPSSVPLVCFRGFLLRIVPALSPLLAHLVHFTPSLVSAELTRRRRNASTCNLCPAASVLQPASLFSCRVRFPLSPYPSRVWFSVHRFFIFLCHCERGPLTGVPKEGGARTRGKTTISPSNLRGPLSHQD